MRNSTLFDDHTDMLLLTYKISTPICVFLNGLAVYLIIFKSSPEMKTYRWHLLDYQIVASAFDIFINCLFQPILFFPLVASTGHGFLITNLGISTFTCYAIFLNLLGGLGFSIVDLFFYRHQCIVMNKLKRKHFYICIALVYAVFIFFANAFALLASVDPSQWMEMLEKQNFMALELLKIPNIYYLPFSSRLTVAICWYLVGTLFFTLLVLWFAFHIFRALGKGSEHLSTRTRKLQRMFFISLIWQVTVPFMFLTIPIVFFCIRIVDGRLGLQILNNAMTMIVSSYGIIATVCLIYFNYPYREFLFGRLKRRSK